MAKQEEPIERVHSASFESMRKTAFESGSFRTYLETNKPVEQNPGEKQAPSGDSKVSTLGELKEIAPQVYEATVQAMMNDTIRRMQRFNDRMRKANRQ
ncbi:MAG: hypothetical protein K0S07_1103 [Chlamydiales bacterium]|jgi:hypothetical protein|nr:hypothetical protein [Chlamydiales bacterium]